MIVTLTEPNVQKKTTYLVIRQLLINEYHNSYLVIAALCYNQVITLFHHQSRPLHDI